MKTRFRVTSVLALAFALAALLAIAGCGSSDDDSGTSGGDTASTEAAASPGVKAAEEQIAEYMEPPTDLGVSEPLSETPTGKRIAFLESGAPAGKQLGDAMEAATAALGTEFTRIPAGLSPQTILKGWSQILADPPDAVIFGGFPTAIMMPQLEKMKELGVPVLTAYTDEAPGLTIAVVGEPQYEATGTSLANFVTAESGGDATTLLVTNRDIPGLLPQREWVEKVYKQNCTGCELDVIEAPLDGIGRTIPGEVVSYLQSHPDTNWIVFGVPEFLAGVPQAIKAAAIDDVQGVTQSETPLVFEYIANDELMTATYGISLEFSSWNLVDSAARAIVGDPPREPGPSPAQFLYEEDMTFDLSKPWPSVENFKEKFEELWGVAK